MRISDWSSDVCSSDLPSGGEKASENGPLRWGTRRMEPLMLNASKTLLPDILAAHGRWVARSEERRVGKECVIRVALGGRRIIKKKINMPQTRVCTIYPRHTL